MMTARHMQLCDLCVDRLLLRQDRQGKYDAAEPLYRETLQLREKVLPRQGVPSDSHENEQPHQALR